MIFILFHYSFILQKPYTAKERDSDVKAAKEDLRRAQRNSIIVQNIKIDAERAITQLEDTIRNLKVNLERKLSEHENNQNLFNKDKTSMNYMENKRRMKVSHVEVLQATKNIIYLKLK